MIFFINMKAFNKSRKAQNAFIIIYCMYIYREQVNYLVLDIKTDIQYYIYVKTFLYINDEL